jgi:uncharacterized protein (TIGR03437 family)
MCQRHLKIILFVWLSCLGAQAVAAQTSTVALVNGASYEAGVAPGSIASLFGSGLASETVPAQQLPLPTTMAGVTVKIGGRVAPMFYVAPLQINLQVPAATPLGTATIEVFAHQSTTPTHTGTVSVVAAAPGLFTTDATGRGQVAALNLDYSINADFDRWPGARPELAGGVVSLYATGLGATNPLVADGEAAPLSPLARDTGVPTVTIGGVDAPVLFSGLAPGFVALWQINVQIPDNLPTNMTTSIRVSKGRASLEATLAVAGKQDFATLSGTVNDGLSGARLANASVSNGSRLVRTNAQGEFTLPVVRVGNQTLEAVAHGFITERQSVTVTANATNSASITLAKQRPNVVMIVVDDLGYADLSVQGSPDIRTPNIDSLAQNGIRFTQAYVTAPVCNASRAALLTGRYQQRFGVELLTHPNLPVSETMLSERLKTLGYATSLVGKWHLGSTGQFLPQQRGYDEFFGFLPALHSYTVWNQPGNPMYRGTQTVTETTYLTDAFTREALDFIERKQTQPFYLRLSYNAPHSPLQAPAEYLARNQHITNTNRRTFAAMMTAVDDGVGKVLAKLRELKLEENTLVLFHSDNGGDPSDNASLNTPLNGEKFELYEGGIRVPVLAQWKGYLPAGVVNTTPIIALDWFTTALSAATGRAIADTRLDGVNLMPLLQGVITAPPHEVLYWRYGAPQYAVRAGDWKLLFLSNSLRLYNLADDPGERTNLANTNPTKRDELKRLYDQWNAQLPPAQ